VNEKKIKSFDLQLFALGTYDPKKVIVSFGGVEIHGFGESAMVSIAPMGDGTGSVVGCDGDVVRTISPDRRNEVTVTLLQSSSSNDYLSTIYARDQSQGDGVLPLIIKDLSGRLTFFDSLAWITNIPEAARTNNASDGEVEWVLHTASATTFIGGHD
jgi:hypothetical protein